MFPRGITLGCTRGGEGRGDVYAKVKAAIRLKFLKVDLRQETESFSSTSFTLHGNISVSMIFDVAMTIANFMHVSLRKSTFEHNFIQFSIFFPVFLIKLQKFMKVTFHKHSQANILRNRSYVGYLFVS